MEKPQPVRLHVFVDESYRDDLYLLVAVVVSDDDGQGIAGVRESGRSEPLRAGAAVGDGVGSLSTHRG